MGPKPIFVFDLHNVIVRVDYQKVKELIKTTPQKYKIILYMLNPLFIFTFLRIFIRDGLGQGLLDELTLRYHWLIQYRTLFIDLIDAQLPIQSTVTLLQHLYENNYHIYLFSNMGEHNFYKLRKRYPALFSLFTGVHFFGPATNWHQKPNPIAFQTFLERFKLCASDILFIDNSKRNIQGAQNLGIPSIRYESLEQLQKDLAATYSITLFNHK